MGYIIDAEDALLVNYDLTSYSIWLAYIGASFGLVNLQTNPMLSIVAGLLQHQNGCYCILSASDYCLVPQK